MTADLVVWTVILTVLVAVLTIGAFLADEKPEWIDKHWRIWR